MKTIQSVSGEKSSAYMALHYPADEYIFAAVLTNDPACVIQDPALRNYAQSKLPWFDWERGGCRELDLTLLNLQKLEQDLSHSITWVAAPFTFDDLVSGTVPVALSRTFSVRNTGRNVRPMLPNKRMRFCTQALKLYPIFWHCWLQGDGVPVVMPIGFRWDERQHVERWTCKNDKIDIPTHCDIAGQFKDKHRHASIEWRIPTFPLYDNGIDLIDVVKFWQGKGWDWPAVSNCDFCFFHRGAEHQHQSHHYPDRAQWWAKQEALAGATFGDLPINDLIDPNQTALFSPDLDQFGCMCGD